MPREITTSSRTYWIFVVCCFLPVLFYPLVYSSPWHSSADVHALLEFASSLFAFMAGVMVLLHFLTAGRLFYLIISAGFIQVSGEEFIHSIFGFERLWGAAGSSQTMHWAISTTWLAGSTCLLLAFLVACIFHKKVIGDVDRNRYAFLFNTLIFALSAGIAFTIFHLPRLFSIVRLGSGSKEALELILSTGFLLVLGLLIRIIRQERRASPLLFSLLGCVIFRCLTHFFDFHAQSYFDACWDSSHLLKLLSYGFPVFGVWAETISVHKRSIAQLAILEQEMAIRKQAEAELQRHKEHLEELVGQRTALLADLNQTLAERTRQAEAANVELREQEERFRALANNISQFAWMADAQGEIFWFNQRWFDYTGTTLDQMYGWGWQKVHHPDHVQRVADRIKHSFETGTVWEDIFPLRGKDGEYRWFLSRAVPMRDEQGKIFRWFGTNTDITERRQDQERIERLNAELRAHAAQLEAANRAKSAFLANMSHELRTPLNAILGFSELMRRDPHLTESQESTLGIINRSGGYLLNLINDVLEMAKIESGRARLNEQPFDLGGMVRDVTEMMRVRAEEKGLRLLLDQSSEFPRYIVGDEVRLRQVLVNLLGNAIKFSAEGGVTLRLGRKSGLPTYLTIEVEDSGPGIAPEDQARIFEPFVQLGEMGANRGTGLGLAITREFAQLMGGGLTVQSALGTGSIFRAEVPLHEASETDIVQKFSAEAKEVKGLAPGQPAYRILIVEDQFENQLLLSRLMESVGLPVKIAENGRIGLELFQSWHPHLIWMDRRMPEMDGVEAAQAIRALPGGKDVKIVAVTASAFHEQKSEMLDAGMDDFIRKPYRSQEIYDSLAKHLGIRFVYDERRVVAETTPLTAKALLVLAEAMRGALKEALESLDDERIHHILQQIASLDPQLHTTLNALIDRYDYPAILKALETIS